MCLVGCEVDLFRTGFVRYRTVLDLILISGAQESTGDPGELCPGIDQVVDGLQPANGSIQINQLYIPVVE